VAEKRSAARGPVLVDRASGRRKVAGR
jgi:hypothetical protein